MIKFFSSSFSLPFSQSVRELKYAESEEVARGDNSAMLAFPIREEAVETFIFGQCGHQPESTAQKTASQTRLAPLPERSGRPLPDPGHSDTAYRSAPLPPSAAFFTFRSIGRVEAILECWPFCRFRRRAVCLSEA